MTRRSMNTVFEDSNDGMLDNTGSSSNLLDRDISTIKQTKRYRIFCEMLETEQNYVDVLKCILIDYKAEFEALDEHDRDLIINKHERQILFAKIENLLSLHEVILSHFENENNAWTGKNMIGYVFAHQKDKLLKHYPPYINSYDEMCEIVNRMQADPNAQQFLRVCESRSVKKFTIKDLLIRPVQRLPSVTILLKELLKATPKSNPDHPCIKLALETIDEVLSKSNEKRRDTDSHQHTLETINNIEQFPPEHVRSSSSFYAQADFQLVHSNGSFRKYKGMVLTFFLFNEMLVVAKRRDRIQSVYYPSQSRLSQTLNSSVSDLSKTLSRTSSIGTLKRSLSFISNVAKVERKPFRFLEMLSFLSFRQFMYIRQDGIFYLKLRDEKSDEWCTLRIAAETTIELAENLMQTLCTLINGASRREVFLLDISSMLNNESFEGAVLQDELDYVKKTRKSLNREYARPMFRFGTLRRIN